MSDRRLQKLFASFKSELDEIPQPLKNRKAIEKIINCRTEKMGRSVYVCRNDDTEHEQFHSCRHRSCYLCARKKRQEWVEKQKSRLFDCPHFHIVFTVPHEYLSLWRFNEAGMSRILFQAAQETLQELLRSEKWGGVTPGILMALHTWGRQLVLHPHVHCLVSAGGMDRIGHWKDLGEYLVPGNVIRRKFRGKFQALLTQGLREHEIVLPDELSYSSFWRLHRSLYRKDWCVRIEERYAHAKGVALYLARYCKGGPLNPKQIVRVDSNRITMSYLDHRDKRVKLQSLDVKVFFERLLSHVPPTGLHTVRYFGLYSPAAKAKHQQCAAVQGTIEEASPSSGAMLMSMVVYCKSCGSPMHLSYLRWRGSKGISINKACRRDSTGGNVQQRDQSDHANVPPIRGPSYSTG